MSRILVTGAAEGIGRATAEQLLDEGHDVVVHARSSRRLGDLRPLLDRGAVGVTADLASADEVRSLAERLAEEPLDAIIHNAGTMDDHLVLPVNVVAPYLLSALLPQPGRVVAVSSSMHRGGRPNLSSIDWSGHRATRTYSDSKLFVTTLMAALARLRPEHRAYAVDPGWVPTRMGGSGAPDDLDQAHRTQVWLATTREDVRNGSYWFHRQRQEPHRSVSDVKFQDELLASLAEFTGVELR